MDGYGQSLAEKANRLIADGQRAAAYAHQLRLMSASTISDSKFIVSMFLKKRARGDAARRIQKTASFVIRDLELTLQVTCLAASAPQSSEKRTRNQGNARHAFDSIVRISKDAVLNHQQRREVDGRLNRLRSALEALGESFR
jgi:hypothetical protein